MFLAFAYDTYYPGGPQADFVGAFDTLADARAAAVGVNMHWATVYDVAAQEWHTFDTA